MNRRRLAPIFLILAGIGLSVTPLAAAKKDTLIIRVNQLSDAAAVASTQRLKIKKTINDGNGTTVIIQGDNIAGIKETLQRDPRVTWTEDDIAILLDGGETVLPLDGGETVLPLGPVSLNTSTGTIQQLLDGGETVLPLEPIKAAYSQLAAMVAPSERLLLQNAFVKIGLYDAVRYVTGRGVIVANLDTGADTCHEVLRGIFTLSFVDGGQPPENCPTSATVKGPGYGHGTAVASLIRVTAPAATVWSLRVFDQSGRALISDIAEAIVYATDRGVDVINMSFGTATNSRALAQAVQYAHRRGVTLIAAAGNENSERLLFPSKFRQVKAVAATDGKDLKANFSNYAREVFVSAPGAGIWAAYPNHQLRRVSGTSYASALAAGEAALLIEALMRTSRGQPDHDSIEDAMERGTVPIDRLAPDQLRGKLGHGRIFVPKALVEMGTSTARRKD